MSEWWSVQNGDKIIEVHRFKRDAEDSASEWGEKYLGMKIQQVEVRPINQPPCEWELQTFVNHLNEDQSHLSLCADWKYVYCPKCGRKLTKEEK